MREDRSKKSQPGPRPEHKRLNVEPTLLPEKLVPLDQRVLIASADSESAKVYQWPAAGEVIFVDPELRSYQDVVIGTGTRVEGMYEPGKSTFPLNRIPNDDGSGLSVRATSVADGNRFALVRGQQPITADELTSLVERVHVQKVNDAAIAPGKNSAVISVTENIRQLGIVVPNIVALKQMLNSIFLEEHGPWSEPMRNLTASLPLKQAAVIATTAAITTSDETKQLSISFKVLRRILAELDSGIAESKRNFQWSFQYMDHGYSGESLMGTPFCKRSISISEEGGKFLLRVGDDAQNADAAKHVNLPLVRQLQFKALLAPLTGTNAVCFNVNKLCEQLHARGFDIVEVEGPALESSKITIERSGEQRLTMYVSLGPDTRSENTFCINMIWYSLPDGNKANKFWESSDAYVNIAVATPNSFWGIASEPDDKKFTEFVNQLKQIITASQNTDNQFDQQARKLFLNDPTRLPHVAEELRAWKGLYEELIFRINGKRNCYVIEQIDRCFAVTDEDIVPRMLETCQEMHTRRSLDDLTADLAILLKTQDLVFKQGAADATVSDRGAAALANAIFDIIAPNSQPRDHAPALTDTYSLRVERALAMLEKAEPRVSFASEKEKTLYDAMMKAQAGGIFIAKFGGRNTWPSVLESLMNAVTSDAPYQRESAYLKGQVFKEETESDRLKLVELGILDSSFKVVPEAKGVLLSRAKQTGQLGTWNLE